MENKRYKIDLDTRAVKMPAGEVIGVYHDKDVNRLTFEVPATYKGIDLTEYQISINYVNEEEQKDVYFILTWWSCRLRRSRWLLLDRMAHQQRKDTM